MARAFFRRRKSCPFSGKQRELARAIKRARHIGLLPYIVK
jgi:ribosomal protein S18